MGDVDSALPAFAYGDDDVSCPAAFCCRSGSYLKKLLHNAGAIDVLLTGCFWGGLCNAMAVARCNSLLCETLLRPRACSRPTGRSCARESDTIGLYEVTRGDGAYYVSVRIRGRHSDPGSIFGCIALHHQSSASADARL